MALITENDEIFNTFKDQFYQDAAQIIPLTLSLDEPSQFKEAVNSLFRIVHNHKAITDYLKIDEIHLCAKHAETVLNIIRQNNTIKDETEIDWLLLLSDQMLLWADELDLGVVDVSATNPAIFTLLKVKEPSLAINDILGKLHLLFINDNETMSHKLLPSFKKIFKQVTYLNQTESLEDNVKEHKPDIIMLSQTFIDAKTHKALHSADDIIPTIALIKDDHLKNILKLINQGIHYHIIRPVTSQALRNTLYSIAQSHFSSRKMIISNKKIRNFIETLDPISDTILEVQKVCDNPNSSIADLTKVIKHDPIMSGLILHATKSPIYALKNITTIDQAVSIFGKRTIKAIALSGLSAQFKCTDLSMYGINEPTFLNIAHLRMRLMSHWYKRVNPELLDTLGLAALLGSLGQMLIAKEIQAQEKEEIFLEALKKQGSFITEYDFLHTSTAAVTSDILYFWKMPLELVDAISYSDDPFDAQDEIRTLSVACHVVFNLIPLTQAKISPVTPELEKMLHENNLRLEDLTAAIKTTLFDKE